MPQTSEFELSHLHFNSWQPDCNQTHYTYPIIEGTVAKCSLKIALAKCQNIAKFFAAIWFHCDTNLFHRPSVEVNPKQINSMLIAKYSALPFKNYLQSELQNQLTSSK